MLHLIRNVSHPLHQSFFPLFSCLVSKLVDASDVSDLVAFAFSAGSIIGLNKDDLTVQEERVSQGLTPRERPINQGSLILKLAFDLALHSPAAVKAAQALQPIQQGVGAPRGMEVIAHVCNLLYSEGYAILKMDATNGFQEIKRSSLHRAVHRRCPSLLSLFQKYYTKESTCFFNLENETRQLTASDGARIGCKLSSFGFALTAQDLYENVKKIIAGPKDGSCIKAATDDVIVILKAVRGEEKAFYSTVNKVCTCLQDGAKEVGLSFVNDKAQLLLPKDWELPGEGILPAGLVVRSNTLPNVGFRGMEIVGTPVGSSDYCKSFVKTTLNAMLRASEDLLQIHPQSATKLLKDCVCAAPSYIAQVCHPAFTKEDLANFDDRVWTLWLRILGGVDRDDLKCCDAALSRARAKTFLPCRYDGVGLKSWDQAAGFAWFTSIASCIAIEDPDLDYARRFLGDRGKDAYEFAMDAVGGPSYLKDSNFEILPVGEPDVLSNSTFYHDLFKDFPKMRLQHEFLDVVCRRANSQFVKTTVHTDTSEKILLRSLKFPGHSILPNLFTANLSQRDVRLTKSEFVIVARQFTCLPPVKNDECDVIMHPCGCEAQLCSNSKCTKKDAVLDSTGNHAIICHPGVKVHKATILEETLERVFRQAGGNPSRQPDTYSLLGGFFNKEDVSRLFPGNLTIAQSDERKAHAMRYLDIMTKMEGHARTSALKLWREQLPATVFDKKDPATPSVVRFDLKLSATTPIDCPRKVICDHAIVHETSPTYAEGVLKFLEEDKAGIPSESPAFQKIVQSKKRRYASVVAVVKRLAEDRRLNYQPEFLFPVISSLGIMNEDMKALMKFILDRFVDTQKGKPKRPDGVEARVIKGRFKVELRNSICFALLRGNALAMDNQGCCGVVNPL